MKRLLYIQNAFDVGGINKITSIKESYFANHDYEVHNLNVLDEEVISPKGMYDEKIVFHSIKLEILNRLSSKPLIGRVLRFFYYRYKLLKKIYLINPDIIIVTQPLLEPLSVVLLSFWKKRVMEFHGWYNNPNIKISIKEKISFIFKFHFYKIIALTKGEANKLHKITGNKVDYIPNPMYWFPNIISDCTNKRIISLARFSPQKRFQDILKYWDIIEAQNDWELHLYGEGPDEAEYRDIIKKKKLTKVFIHQYTKNVESELAKASIFILPSNHEGFPLVLLEAMGSGIPCVAYDCPFGPSEIIKNGVDGFISKYKNPNDMIDKILLLIRDNNLRIEMGKKARKNIQRYNIDEIMERWIFLFENKYTHNY